MPGVTKDGKPSGSYGYDIGGGSEKSDKPERGEKFPETGTLGRLDKLNVDRFITKKDSDGPAAQMGKTGYESSTHDKNGNVKVGPKSDVKFLESDGTWAPAEGRGAGCKYYDTTGRYSKPIIGKG